jgi:hypothetical protein
MESLAGCNFRRATMHFKGTRCCDNDGGVGFEPTDTALDIAELLHPHVGTESTFSENVTFTVGGFSLFRPSEFQSHTVRQNGRVSMSDVRERPGMHKYGSTLHIQA